MMYNLPAPSVRNGGVFYCSCGFNTVKKPIRNDGHRDCPVCGNQVDFIQSEGRMTDHYECTYCVGKIERRLNHKPFLAERLERSRSDRILPGHMFVVTVLVCLVLLISTCAMAIMAIAATETEIQIDLRPDPAFSDIMNRQELGNGSIPTSTIDHWQNDLGGDFPNGTYYGTLFEGSAFEVTKFRPYWYPYDQTASTGRFSFAMLSGHFNFTARTIMSGASEWWLKVPILASSVEVSAGIYLAIFEGASDLDQIQFDEQPYGNKYFHIRPSWNGHVPDDFVFYYFPDWVDHRGDPAFDHSGAGDLYVNNDHVYLRVHSILRPETDYVISIAFRLPEEGSLTTLWTGAESPAGRETRICWADYLITDIDSNDTYAFNMTGQEIVDIDMDLDWSFIFTEGVGDGGLFGFRFEVVNGTTLYTYPFLNTTVDPAKDGLIHPSFMLPWVSDDEFEINFYVSNMLDEGKIGPQDFHHWQFEPDGDNPTSQTFTWWPDINYTYRDFALFSVNWTLDFDNIDYPFTDEDRYNVRLGYTFLNSGNLTLLCYDIDRPTIDWSDIEPWHDNSTTWPWARPFIFDSSDYGVFTLNYGIFNSAYGTEGEWAQVQQNTTTGRKIFTYHFPNRIDLSPMEWTIKQKDSEDAMSPAEVAWQESYELWGKGHKFRAIAQAFKATAMTIWEGGTRIVAFIHDGISDLWEGMKALGEWLWTSMVSLYETIVSFFEDLVDILVDMWDVVKYLVSPLILMAIYGAAIGTMKNFLRDRVDLRTKVGRMVRDGGGGAS